LPLNPILHPKTKFKSKKEFMDVLEGMLAHSGMESETIIPASDESRGRPTELKTYIMESNNAIPNIEAVSTLDARVIETTLSNISLLELKYGGKPAFFYLDTSDPRFFVLYSNELAETTEPFYNRLVNSPTNKFDKTWYPTETLGEFAHMGGNKFLGFGLSFNDRFSPEPEDEQPLKELTMDVTGRISEKALDALREKKELRRTLSYSKIRALRGDKESYVINDVRFDGRLISKSGDSIDDHVSLVDGIKKKYREFIERIERNCISTQKIENRTLIHGQAFDLNLEREIPNLDHFLDYFLSPAGDFRLWGLRNKIYKDRCQVVAIDLHTGDSFDLEITPHLIRVYLPKGACGNVMLRMYVNLQRTFDSEIRFNEEQLLIN